MDSQKSLSAEERSTIEKFFVKKEPILEMCEMKAIVKMLYLLYDHLMPNTIYVNMTIGGKMNHGQSESALNCVKAV